MFLLFGWGRTSFQRELSADSLILLVCVGWFSGSLGINFIHLHSADQIFPSHDFLYPLLTQSSRGYASKPGASSPSMPFSIVYPNTSFSSSTVLPEPIPRRSRSSNVVSRGRLPPLSGSSSCVHIPSSRLYIVTSFAKTFRGGSEVSFNAVATSSFSSLRVALAASSSRSVVLCERNLRMRSVPICLGPYS